MFDTVIALDFHLFTMINSLEGGEVSARLFRALTLLGDIRWFVPIVLASSVLLFGRRWWRAATYLTVALVLTGLLTLIGKTAFDRPRPPVVAGLCEDANDRPAPLAADALFHSQAPEHPVTLRTVRTCAMSFPSGHTAAAFTWLLGLALALGASRRLVFGALALASLVGLSRVVLGVHYPLDTLVGAALGIASALGCARLVAPRTFAAPAPAPELALAGATASATAASPGGDATAATPAAELSTAHSATSSST